MQFDADTVGAPGPEADAEMCMMMADTMDALGLQGKYVVKVNNRKLLDGALDARDVGEDKRLTVLRALDKYDRLGQQGVRSLTKVMGGKMRAVISRQARNSTEAQIRPPDDAF